MPKLQLAIAGIFEGHHQGGFTLTPDDINRMIFNFNGREVVVDYEHQSVWGDISPAAGWVTELWMDESGEKAVLMGEVKWNDNAAEMIAAGEYKYLSPVIDFWAYDPNTGYPIGAHLDSVGLTNTPFMTELAPVTNAAQPSKGLSKIQLQTVTKGAVVNSRKGLDEAGTRPAPTAKKNNQTHEDELMNENWKGFLNRFKKITGSEAEGELDVLDDARMMSQAAAKTDTLTAENKRLQAEIGVLKAAAEDRRLRDEADAATSEADLEAADEALINSAVANYQIRKADAVMLTGALKKDRPGITAYINGLPRNHVKPQGPDAPNEKAMTGNAVMNSAANAFNQNKKED